MLVGRVAALDAAFIIQAIAALIDFIRAASSTAVARGLATVGFIDAVVLAAIKLVVGIALIGAFVFTARLARIFAILVAALVGLVTGKEGGIGVVVISIATIANITATPVLAAVNAGAPRCTTTSGLGIFACVFAAALAFGARQSAAVGAFTIQTIVQIVQEALVAVAAALGVIAAISIITAAAHLLARGLASDDLGIFTAFLTFAVAVAIIRAVCHEAPGTDTVFIVTRTSADVAIAEDIDDEHQTEEEEEVQLHGFVISVSDR